jgi:hypothetical protein
MIKYRKIAAGLLLIVGITALWGFTKIDDDPIARIMALQPPAGKSLPAI